MNPDEPAVTTTLKPATPVTTTTAKATTAPVKTTAATTSRPVSTVAGDANGDFVVDVSDAVLIARFCAEDSSVDISRQGIMNADFDHSGCFASAAGSCYLVLFRLFGGNLSVLIWQLFTKAQ